MCQRQIQDMEVQECERPEYWKAQLLPQEPVTKWYTTLSLCYVHESRHNSLRMPVTTRYLRFGVLTTRCYAP